MVPGNADGNYLIEREKPILKKREEMIKWWQSPRRWQGMGFRRADKEVSAFVRRQSTPSIRREGRKVGADARKLVIGWSEE